MHKPDVTSYSMTSHADRNISYNNTRRKSYDFKVFSFFKVNKNVWERNLALEHALIHRCGIELRDVRLLIVASVKDLHAYPHKSLAPQL